MMKIVKVILAVTSLKTKERREIVTGKVERLVFGETGDSGMGDGGIGETEESGMGEGGVGETGDSGTGDGDMGEGGNSGMGDIHAGLSITSSTLAGVPEYLLERGCCTSDMTGKFPIEFFQLLVTDDMLRSIVHETNRYAKQFISSHDLGPRCRVQQWDHNSHTLSELKKFLALLIVMGLISLPKIEDHWVTTWPFASSTFSGVMTRDRFSLIMKLSMMAASTFQRVSRATMLCTKFVRSWSHFSTIFLFGERFRLVNQ